jgi:uncharacterized protein DUF4265
MQMTNQNEVASLSFALDVEDDWPPFAVESLPFSTLDGGFCLQKPPLFVKDLSVGDVIGVDRNQEGLVTSWWHIVRSSRTTAWLLRLQETDEIASVLSNLRELGCNTVGLDSVGCYSIDIPESVDIETIDSILSQLDSDCVAVAFPSLRHPEGPIEG